MKWDSDMMWYLYCVAMAVIAVRMNSIFWERLSDILDLVQRSYNLVLLVLLVNTCFLVYHRAANQVAANTHASVTPLYCLAMAFIVFHMPSMFWERFFDVLDLVQESYNLVLLIFLVNSCFLVCHRAACQVTGSTLAPDPTPKTSKSSSNSGSRSDPQGQDASSSSSSTWNELQLAWERSAAEKLAQVTNLSKTIQDQATTIGQLTAIIHAHPLPPPSTPAADDRTTYIAFLENNNKDLNGELAAAKYELRRAANKQKRVPANAHIKCEEQVPAKSADVTELEELRKALTVERNKREELVLRLADTTSQPLWKRLARAETALEMTKDRIRVLENEIAQMQDAASAATILSGEITQSRENAPAAVAYNGEFAHVQDPVAAAATTGEIAQMPEMVPAVTAVATPVEQKVELELEAARLANERLGSEVATLQSRLDISTRESEQTMADKAVLQAHLERCIMEKTQLDLHNKESVSRVRDLESAGQSLQHQYTTLDTQLQQTIQTGQILESEHDALKASHDALTCELAAVQGRLEFALTASTAVQPAPEPTGPPPPVPAPAPVPIFNFGSTDGQSQAPLPLTAPVFTFGSNNNDGQIPIDLPAVSFDFICIDWEAKHKSLELELNEWKLKYDSLLDDTMATDASMKANHKRIEDDKAQIQQMKKQFEQVKAAYISCKRGRDQCVQENDELQGQLASAGSVHAAMSENFEQLKKQLDDVDMQLRNCQKNKKIIENRNMEIEKKDNRTYKALQLQGLRLSKSTDDTLIAVVDTATPHGLRYRIMPNARALAAELTKLGNNLEEDLVKRPDDERYGRR